MALTTLKRKRAPRNKAKMISMITNAQRLYLETGGEDTEHRIEAAKRQLARCERYAEHPPEGQQAKALALVNAAMRELRQAEQLREKKVAACRKLIEEMHEAAEIEQDYDQPDPTPETPPSQEQSAPDQPDTTDSPEDLHDQSGS